MNFGEALAALKNKQRVARAGWNGKGQLVYMMTFREALQHLQPCFVLHNAQGLDQPGWVPSMGDLLAEDWQIVTE